ncbi:MAG TPA: hypothetical protein VMA77_22040 [Solirubrobacteraceae bacterium]|nr:hypothetical protein [Solirubrobacteraceae bacterium]
MPPINLSWSDAEVKDAELSVPLDGETPKAWRQTFERTVALLGHGDWGEITVKKDRVLVSDVTPGSEEKLKHHLDAVVVQANATVGDAEEDEEAEAEEVQARDDAGEDQRDDPDAEMTERFRSD